MKRILSLSLALIMALAFFSVPVEAANTTAEAEEILSSVEIFLRNYAEKTLLYEDNDVTTRTVIDAAIPMTVDDIDRIFELPSGVANLAKMQDNILFVESVSASDKMQENAEEKM